MIFNTLVLDVLRLLGAIVILFVLLGIFMERHDRKKNESEESDE